MKILISGSNQLNSYNYFCNITESIISKIQYDKEISLKDITFLSFDSPNGTDYYVRKYCLEKNLNLNVVKIDWNNTGNIKRPINWGNTPVCLIGKSFYGEYNKLAKFLANQEAVDECVGEICIAFDAEEKKGSTGTRDMIKRAKKSWMKVYHVKCHDLENIEIKVYNEGLQKE